MQSDCWQVYEQSSATAAIAFIHVCTRVDDDGLRALLSWKLLGLFVGSATPIKIITRLRLALSNCNQIIIISARADLLQL
jgi:hypothetical protein